MIRIAHIRGVHGLAFVVMACILSLFGCQGGIGPAAITSPDKSAGVGAPPPPPPPPPADPAVAFVLKRGGRNLYDLKVMNADGARVTTIYTSSSFNLNLPSWSPDGQSIAYHETGDLWRIDVTLVGGTPTGTNRTVLLSRATSISAPAWSPVGDLIAFCDPSLRTLETIPAGGGAPVVLYTAPPGTAVFSVAWSPDASQIAFTEGGGIKVLEIAGGAVTTVLSPTWGQQFPGGGPSFLDWARTQDALTFSVGSTNSHDLAVYTLQLPSGSPVLVADDGHWPTWSPNDQMILLEDRGLKKIALASGQVTNIGTNGQWPDWRRF